MITPDNKVDISISIASTPVKIDKPETKPNGYVINTITTNKVRNDFLKRYIPIYENIVSKK